MLINMNVPASGSRRPILWLAGLLLSVLIAPLLTAAEPPPLTLQSGATILTIARPDAEQGYYRGPRFVWGGMVVQAQWNGHTVFTELKQPHNPVLHDHAAGACDEFGIDGALGYDEAAVGDATTGGDFLKIGVGALRRTRDKEYFFGHPYPIVRAGTWTVVTLPSEVRFVQEFHLNTEWGYRYAKTVSVQANGFTIHNALSNRGTKTIVTDHYNHHMFAIDQQPIDGTWSLLFGWDVQAKVPQPSFSMTGRALALTGPLTQTLWTDFTWATAPATTVPPTTALSLHHAASNTAIDIVIDAPPAKVALYGETRALCPEPFTAIHLEPGQSQSWTTTYTFHPISAAK